MSLPVLLFDQIWTSILHVLDDIQVILKFLVFPHVHDLAELEAFDLVPVDL